MIITGHLEISNARVNMSTLSQEQIKDFHERGFIVLKGFLVLMWSTGFRAGLMN